MKITVLSGSPKGNLSVTLQYIHYIQKKYPQHEFNIHHVSQKIKAIEKKEDRFQKIVQDVGSSDAVWWVVPVYVMLVPSQYKRFIELIWKYQAQAAFKDKYTAVFTTSIHFYDHTANSYMRAICDDLDMRFVDFLSLKMFDLLDENERTKLHYFTDRFFSLAEKGTPTARCYPKIAYQEVAFIPETPLSKIDTGGKKILLISDQNDHSSNLGKMIQRFEEAFEGQIETVFMGDLKIMGGCLGCIKCGFENKCTYEGIDDYIEFFNTKIVPADIVVYAGAIKDRYLSADFKQFFDRKFFNTHIPVQRDKQIAFILSGPLGQVANLREILQAMIEMDMGNLAGIVTDESGDSQSINGLIQDLAENLVNAANVNYVKPMTFLGIGGRKLFRDEVYSNMRFPFLADHEYYEANGFYDFPDENSKEFQHSVKMLEAIKDPEFRKQVRNSMTENLVKPLQEFVEKNA